MRRFHDLLCSAALVALCSVSAAGDESSGGSGPAPAKTDPAPHPLAAADAAPAVAASVEPKADPHPNAVGPIEAAPPAPPPPSPALAASVLTNPSRSDPEPPTQAKKGRTVVVWAQPGHEVFGIGQLLRLPKEKAEQLRSAGRARYASDAEVKVAGDRVLDVEAV